MGETATLSPILSPGFSRARQLSRVMTVFFTIAFVVMAMTMLAAPIMAIFKTSPIMMILQKTPGSLNLDIGLNHGIRISLSGVSGWPAIGAMLAVEVMVLPIVLTLHHARKLFGCFAKGEVFAATPIGHIRAAGLWLTVSFFADIAGVTLLRYCGQNQHIGFLEFIGALFTGIAITIVANVMSEAHRIASDHAEIV